MPVPQTKKTNALTYTRKYSFLSVSLKFVIFPIGVFSAWSPVAIRSKNNSMNGNRVTMKRPKASRIRTVLSKEPIVVQNTCKEIGRANLLRKFERKDVMNERPRHEYSGPLRRGRRSFLPKKKKKKNVYIYNLWPLLFFQPFQMFPLSLH